VDFACLWLQSQERDDPRQRLPDALRPDRCKVVFCPATDPSIMAATTMPDAPNAWLKRNVQAAIDLMLKAGLRVVIGPPNSTNKIMLDRTGQHPVQMTPPDENGMQWNIPPRRPA
jgi:hypothetical protein